MDIEDMDYTTKDVVTPRNGIFQVYVDYYWWCEDGDPKKAVFFMENRPQCNSDKGVLEHYHKPYPECELVQIPVSYIKRTQ